MKGAVVAVYCQVCCRHCSFHITLDGLAVAANFWHSKLHAEDEEGIYIAFSDEPMVFWDMSCADITLCPYLSALQCISERAKH